MTISEVSILTGRAHPTASYPPTQLTHLTQTSPAHQVSPTTCTPNFLLSHLSMHARTHSLAHPSTYTLTRWLRSGHISIKEFRNVLGKQMDDKVCASLAFTYSLHTHLPCVHSLSLSVSLSLHTHARTHAHTHCAQASQELFEKIDIDHTGLISFVRIGRVRSIAVIRVL